MGRDELEEAWGCHVGFLFPPTGAQLMPQTTCAPGRHHDCVRT